MKKANLAWGYEGITATHSRCLLKAVTWGLGRNSLGERLALQSEDQNLISRTLRNARQELRST